MTPAEAEEGVVPHLLCDIRQWRRSRTSRTDKALSYVAACLLIVQTAVVSAAN